MEYKTVPIEQVKSRVKQVRQEFDSEFLDELTQSIKKEGILVPIMVRSSGKGYEIIAGEQRWRAAKLAKLKAVPVSIIDADEKKASELALIDNIKRKDLQGWEREDAIAEMWKSGHYKSKDDLASALGFGRPHLEDILKARELRDKESLPDGASTRMITTVQHLDAPTRKAILDAQESGKLPKDVHDTTELISHLRKAKEEARPHLVEAYVKQKIPMDGLAEVAEIVEDKLDVQQILDAKRTLPEREYKSVVSYIKSQKDKGNKPVIKTVVQGDLPVWNAYLSTVEAARAELFLLTPRKCVGWDESHRKQLKTALLAIEKHVQDMLNALENEARR